MKNFKDDEFHCNCGCHLGVAHMDRSFLLWIEKKLRVVLNEPIILISTIRCEGYNRLVGGEDDSAHLTGEAADIYTPDTGYRSRLISAAKACGCRRIGIAADVTHLDRSIILPQDVMWTYY